MDTHLYVDCSEDINRLHDLAKAQRGQAVRFTRVRTLHVLVHERKHSAEVKNVAER